MITAPGLRGLRASSDSSGGQKEHSRKKLLGAKGIASRSKDATKGSWPYY